MQTSNLAIQSGARFSLIQLFARHQLTIEVPIIQRDYAQGRETAQEVRDRFLESLFQYLNENIPGRDLDFVYGSIDAGGRFIPLDGQQRLTTLFLLHWYLALASGRMSELQSYFVKDDKSKFTYKTRSSAKEFCDALMTKGDQIHRGVDPISTSIKDTGWFFSSWTKDPTVQSMLVMLDAIESRFKEHAAFFERLMHQDHPIITFMFLNLQEFELTDDLYIKMNSRGRQLTSFENFKAKLEQKIDELFGQVSTLKIEFAQRIDTTWADFFWKYRDSTTNLFDEQVMRFIRIILSNWLAINGDSFSNEPLEILLNTKNVRDEGRGIKDVTFFHYEKYGTLKEDSILLLIQSFNQLLRVTEISDEELGQLFNYRPRNVRGNSEQDDVAVTIYRPNVLQEAFNADLSNVNRIKLHAFLSYFIRYEDIAGLRDWMLVVTHLADNTIVDDVDTLVRCLKEIDKLIPHANDILLFLARGGSGIDAFYQRQVQEERIKACLVLKGKEWLQLIRHADSDPFFDGQIGFLLEFSGILEYFEHNGHCNWAVDEDTQFRQRFEAYKLKAEIAFAYAQDFREEALWERAVLTKGDYLISASASRKNLLTDNIRDRDYSWKRLLRLNRSGDKNDELNTKRGLIKEVFDDVRFTGTDMNAICLALIEDVPKDWRSYFIRNPRLFQVCTKGFIRFDREASIKLLPKTRITYHYELRTYNLYTERLKDTEFLCWGKATYVDAYGDYGTCFIRFQRNLADNINHVLDFCFKDQFEGEFYITTDNVRETTMDPTIDQNLTKSGMSYDHGRQAYTWMGINEASVLELINNLDAAILSTNTAANK